MKEDKSNCKKVKEEVSAREMFKTWQKENLPKPVKGCRSCEFCTERVFRGEHLGYECSKGIDEKDREMFFDGTDGEEIDCEEYKWDNYFSYNTETVFKKMNEEIMRLKKEHRQVEVELKERIREKDDKIELLQGEVKRLGEELEEIIDNHPASWKV